MSEARFHTPGFWTLVVHFLVIVTLFAVLMPVTVLRVIFAPVAELLIRAHDDLGDALSERLNR